MRPARWSEGSRSPTPLRPISRARRGKRDAALSPAPAVLYPQQFPDDLRATTKQFYKLFHQVDLSEARIDALLMPATPSKREQ